MRGVYIKGIENSDHCLRCPMRGIEDECVLQGVEVCTKYENWEQQKANCPLVPLPPHGRLIDADKFASEMRKRQEAARKWLRTAKYAETVIRANAVLTFLVEVKLTLNNAPTVIEAEEEENNG